MDQRHATLEQGSLAPSFWSRLLPCKHTQLDLCIVQQASHQAGLTAKGGWQTIFVRALQCLAFRWGHPLRLSHVAVYGHAPRLPNCLTQTPCQA